MWPPLTSMILPGLVSVFLGAVSTVSGSQFFKKVGDDIVLKPNTTIGPITSIDWKVGPNIAAQWEGGDIDLYRQFKERGSLNISSGEMAITGLTWDDSSWYTVEINSVLAGRTHLTVLFPVPTPSVVKECDGEMSSCVLACEGNTTGAQPVTYIWKSGDVVLKDPFKTHRITKEDTSGMSEFSCELENPVSKEISRPIPNPFLTAPGSGKASESDKEESLKISTGVIVFLCLLASVVLLGVIHRVKAGSWFFQKESMPWTTDFWRKEERTRRDESNGTASQVVNGPPDEETPMT